MKAMCKIVAYRRTSTEDQQLGIDGQDATLLRISQDKGCPIVKSFTEHESGGNNERPELDKAIRYARRIGATLVVAKLDRLARDQAFLLKLVDGDVPILFGDLPEVDGRTPEGRAMIQMMAMFAEFERRRIGTRTKEALAALKAQGVKLGTPRNLKYEDRIKGAKISAQRSHQKAIDQMSDAYEVARPMRDEGATLQDIADHLNEQEYMTARGSRWTAAQVLRLLARVKAAS